MCKIHIAYSLLHANRCKYLKVAIQEVRRYM